MSAAAGGLGHLDPPPGGGQPSPDRLSLRLPPDLGRTGKGPRQRARHRPALDPPPDLARIPAHTSRRSRGRGGSARHTHARDSNYLLPHKMFLLSTTAHTSALLPASLNNTKPAQKPLSRRRSRAHNRLSGAGASGGGLEVPPRRERRASAAVLPSSARSARPGASPRPGGSQVCPDTAPGTGKRPTYRQLRCPFPCTPLSKRLSNQFAARNMLIANGAH